MLSVKTMIFDIFIAATLLETTQFNAPKPRVCIGLTIDVIFGQSIEIW